MSEAEEKSKEEGSGVTSRRLSDSEFTAARELYELGKMGLGELAEEYKISRQALSKRFKDAGAKKGSRSHEVAAAAAAAAAKAAIVVERFAEKRAEWIEETRIEGVKVLQQVRLLARKSISDAVKAGRPAADVDEDMRAIARFNRILIDNLSTSLDILGVNEHVDEEDLPKLTIEDLTNEEILRHHKNTGALPEDTTIEEMLAEEINVGDL